MPTTDPVKSDAAGKSRKSSERTRFGWQALLILLPVGVLAVVGASFVRQDRRLVEQEARERAQAIAESLTQIIARGLASTELAIGPQSTLRRSNRSADRPWTEQPPSRGDADAPRPTFLAFQFDAEGNPVIPPRVPALEPAPLDPSRLSPGQRDLWATANRAEAEGWDPSRLLGAWQAIVDADPPLPASFATSSRLRLATLLEAGGDLQQAAKILADIVRNQPETQLETGLPALPVAAWRLLSLAARAPAATVARELIDLDTLCSNAVMRPTLLSGAILDQAAAGSSGVDSSTAETWRHAWQYHETLRRMFRCLPASMNRPLPSLAAGSEANQTGNHSVAPDVTWTQFEGEDWLVTRQTDAATNTWVVGNSTVSLRTMLAEAQQQAQPVPPHLGLRFLLGGRELARPVEGHGSLHPKQATPDGGAGLPWGIAAAPGQPHPLIRTEVFLADATALYRRQQARTLWLGGLLAVSAVAALAGLAATWHSFQRQLRLSEMKSVFVSSASHELRAPIASVRLMAENLERGRVTEPGKRAEYYRLMVQECRRLGALIENVLDFSRIDQGRRQFEFEPTDLVALVRQTTGLLEPVAVERGVPLILRLPEPPEAGRCSEVVVDGRALQQALINLIDNALKHSAAGQNVEVEMSASGSAPERKDSTLELSVRDHGPGIPFEDQQRIFEPFFRRGSELRRETQGIGIGLSIVKHVAEAHGGSVHVESQLGQGSRFAIRLPLTTWPPDPELKPTA